MSTPTTMSSAARLTSALTRPRRRGAIVRLAEGSGDRGLPDVGSPWGSARAPSRRAPSPTPAAVSLAPPALSALSRADLSAYFENTWQLYEDLFASIDAPDALYVRPDALRHPLVFYLGHTAAFYANKLRLAGLLSDGVDDELDVLFARGVDPHSAAELGDNGGWPDVSTVRAYRERVRDRVRSVIDASPDRRSVGWSDPAWSVLMGLEHDRIHLETSSVLFRQLDHARLRRPAGWRIAPVDPPAPAMSWRSIPSRVVRLGRPDDAPLYGWDNEYGRLERDVSAFRVTAHMVTQASYFEFVQDSGYTDRRLWTDAGWRWRVASGALRPRFWTADAVPRYRATFEIIDMPWSWPVQVNAHEAAAFCRWLGAKARLPTEAEHHAIAEPASLSEGDVITDPHYNLNLRFASASPVEHFAPTSDGVFDVYGNVWEWLSDDFAPLPGFEAHPYYADFSAPFFGAEHAALRGGSWATTGAGASRHYRLWFRRHFYQHAGFRVVRPV